MRKFINPLPAGGAPLFNTEANGVLNREIWEAMEQQMTALIYPIGAMIITGGVITDNGSTFDITSGIALISGEFMEFDASSSNPYPSYLGASTTVVEQIEYADAVDRDYVEDKRAEMYAAIPGGTYVAINSANALGVNFNTFLARQWDLNAVTDDRLDEAGSRPDYIGEVDAAGVLTENYSAGGTWTVTKTATGTYQLRKNGSIVTTPVIVTCRTTGVSAIYTASYDFNVGNVHTGAIATGGFADIGFSFVVYP